MENKMVINPKRRNIAYRCPECATTILGLVGKFALSANMVRLKCSCESAGTLDITRASDGKIRLSVPCIFCKQNHNYVVTESLFFDRELFLLNCPYSGMDIAFIGDEEAIAPELKRTEDEINRLIASFEADDISDLQPKEMGEDELLPDPAVYDTLRFIVKDLEEEGRVKCLCQDGKYDLRFTDGGLQVYCGNCGATHDFPVTSQTLSEEYLSLDEINLR